ncbi:unnamed protein product [Caenorhabditis angaria]|uniref:Fungal lipase-type domain-containing protein n=1 Tax=Caenorhabditis angaria TaxID=860376 RepID=A0A9P1MZR5_9PELO|nr:unnamed protein product [Caenorhabditis angaria]
MKIILLLLISLILVESRPPKKEIEPKDLCVECVQNGKEWCNSKDSCDEIFCPSEHSIMNIINCPKAEVEARFAYDDEFIRKKILITTAAVSSDNPQICFDNQMPTMKLFNTYDVNCSTLPPQTSCFAYTAIDEEQKVIAIGFRGTQNNLQLAEELVTYFYNAERRFFDIGNIFSYFFDAFLFIWQGGLEQDIQEILRKYPKFEIWVNGHSMGGALASVAASYMVHEKLMKPDNVKLITMGQPRTGDYDYALWHDNTFPYSYRIVHNRDIIAHVPPQIGPGYNLHHHRTEIWYPNDMEIGAEFHKCTSSDGYYCSATLDFNLTYNDHGLYFVKEMPAWGGAGCPSFWIS